MLGDQCIGCGYCCLRVTCVVGVFTYGDETPCKGLQWDEEKQRLLCRLITEASEEKIAERKRLIAAETGCSSSLFNAHRDHFLSGKGREHLAQAHNWPFNS